MIYYLPIKGDNPVNLVVVMNYSNPVRRGFYPDPSVIRVGEDFIWLTLISVFSMYTPFTF